MENPNKHDIISRPDLINRRAVEKRLQVLKFKRYSRPGLFESLGSFDPDVNEMELFKDDRYLDLRNVLLFQSQF